MQKWFYNLIQKKLYPIWIKIDLLKYLFLIPLFGIIIFIITVITILYTLHSIDEKNQQSLLYRDLPWLNNKVLSYVQNNEQHLKHIIQNVKPFFYDDIAFAHLSKQFLKEHAEALNIYRLNNQHQVLWSQSILNYNSDIDEIFNIEKNKPSISIINNIEVSRKTQKSSYILIKGKINQQQYIILTIPLFQDLDFIGSLNVIYEPQKLMQFFLFSELVRDYHITLTDNNNSILFNSSPNIKYDEDISHSVPFALLPNQLKLKASRYTLEYSFFNNTLVWVIIVLSILIIWSLLMLWRYMYRNAQSQKLLLAESAFRKSMGDTILVGMRAIDIRGKIIYVNPAFCRMTGFSEIELLETHAPFVYWPRGDYKELYKIFHDLIDGRTPASGVEVRLQRKDGSIFYARMHAAKLMDGSGKQIGWLNSIIDVTEQKRAREELASAHRRFMTVVESLEAAVSILNLDTNELLFSNRYYLHLFGQSNYAHLYLGKFTGNHQTNLTAIDWLTNIMPKIDSSNTFEEIYYPNNKKWFNIRTYPIQWVDGRIAQMLVAVDITETKIAQEQARINEEKWHFVNRVSNMGEMASSLAHELNQPLTAIANYCNGAIERIQQDNLQLNDNILKAIEKAAAQAIKAGGIIKRLRGFVSKSEPKKHFEDIANIAKEAIALVNFTITQTNINVKLTLGENLPFILVDKILIEQVLVNLLKNAIEATYISKNNSNIVELKIFTDKIDNTLHIYVIDEGDGIDNNIKDKIFDAFFSTKQQGMGMGLNICRSIIENHRGNLTVDNNQHKGCTFKIILPLLSNIA